jgi:hypothetical protein
VRGLRRVCVYGAETVLCVWPALEAWMCREGGGRTHLRRLSGTRLSLDDDDLVLADVLLQPVQELPHGQLLPDLEDVVEALRVGAPVERIHRRRRARCVRTRPRRRRACSSARASRAGAGARRGRGHGRCRGRARGAVSVPVEPALAVLSHCLGLGTSRSFLGFSGGPTRTTRLTRRCGGGAALVSQGRMKGRTCTGGGSEWGACAVVCGEGVMEFSPCARSHQNTKILNSKILARSTTD